MTDREPAANDRVVDPTAARCAGRLLRERERRAEHWSHRGGLFTDPAWDMLLLLFVNEADGRATLVSEVCVAGGTAPTTGLRFIDLMLRAGLIVKRRDPDDNCKCFVALTSRGMSEMTSYLAALVS